MSKALQGSNFKIRDFHFEGDRLRGFLRHVFEHSIRNSGNQALLPGTSHHRVALSRSRLAVGENARIKTGHSIAQHFAPHVIKHCRLIRETALTRIHRPK